MQLNQDMNFFELVEHYQIPAMRLSQICSAPIKVLCEWYDSGTVPDDTLASLRQYLNV